LLVSDSDRSNAPQYINANSDGSDEWQNEHVPNRSARIKNYEES